MLKKFGPRIYRDNNTRLPWQTELRCETSDIRISSSCAIDNSHGNKVLASIRHDLRSHIDAHPEFVTSLAPLSLPHHAPGFILDMYRVAEICGVGPLAAVAGAIAAELGRRLDLPGEELVIENGGDIHLQGNNPLTAGVFAASLHFPDPLFLRVDPRQSSGICTSSASIGPSFNFGRADAVTVIAESAALADAAATAAANLAPKPSAVPFAMESALSWPGVHGILIIIDDKIGLMGDIELTAPDDDDALQQIRQEDTP